MNKKGFTLVELLAVIAILAILVIITLPNIMKLFNEAKKNSFLNEIKIIFNTAHQQWISESMFSTNEKTYSRCKEGCLDNLALSGRKEIDYYIRINRMGNVVAFYATDGTYQYSYEGEGLTIENIDEISSITDNSSPRVIIKDNSATISRPIPDSSDFLMNSGGSSISSNGIFLRTNIYRKNIETITFINSLQGHSSNNIDCWDVSYGRNGSVLAWANDSDNDGLYEVTIGTNGIIYAREVARLFAYMNNLENIYGWEFFDVSKISSFSEMFMGCSKLKEIDLSYFDTKNANYMGSMFYGCSSLTSLDISPLDTKNVNNMSHMFNECSGLTSLDISPLNTSKVTDMEGMFWGMTSLTSLDLSHLDTSNVTNMHGMLGRLENVTTLDLSGFDTSKVEKMSRMFMNDTKLQSITFGTFDTSSVTTMQEMFADCSSLTSLNLSGFNTSKVQSMVGMFRGLTNISTLNINGFNTSKVLSMANMFKDDTKITTLDLSTFNTSNVTNTAGMFNGCSTLKTIYASDSFVTTNITSSNNMFYVNSKLVGGQGTKYSSSHKDKTYAHIDGGTSNPGYFTSK